MKFIGIKFIKMDNSIRNSAQGIILIIFLILIKNYRWIILNAEGFYY